MARSNIRDASVWKDGFLFVGNHLALDFLNTRPVQDGEAMELLPDFAALRESVEDEDDDLELDMRRRRLMGRQRW